MNRTFTSGTGVKAAGLCCVFFSFIPCVQPAGGPCCYLWFSMRNPRPRVQMMSRNSAEARVHLVPPSCGTGDSGKHGRDRQQWGRPATLSAPLSPVSLLCSARVSQPGLGEEAFHPTAFAKQRPGWLLSKLADACRGQVVKEGEGATWASRQWPDQSR